MAVVDLTLMPAPLRSRPAFRWSLLLLWQPAQCRGHPDGQYVVMAETESADGTYHLLFISTAIDSLATDNAITTIRGRR